VKASTKRTVRVWSYRARAVAWAVVGVLSFVFGWANSVVLVWIASLYANIGTDLGSAEAADDRELIDRLDRLEQGQREILRRLGGDDQ
jgi:hypothetical protein